MKCRSKGKHTSHIFTIAAASGKGTFLRPPTSENCHRPPRRNQVLNHHLFYGHHHRRKKQRSISVLARKYVGMKIVVSAAFWRKIEEEKNNSCPFRDISLYAFCNTFLLGWRNNGRRAAAAANAWRLKIKQIFSHRASPRFNFFSRWAWFSWALHCYVYVLQPTGRFISAHTRYYVHYVPARFKHKPHWICVLSGVLNAHAPTIEEINKNQGREVIYAL